MALVDVIKYEAPDDTIFVWKHPTEKIKLGSQLIVNEGQQAIFVKGGEALDTFRPGTHTLISGNLPLIERIVNLPFGGDSPFTADVWYVNTTVKRDLKWGTPSTIPLMDPVLGFPVSARAFGKWGVRIDNPRSFVTQIVGSQRTADADKVHAYFIGIIVQSLEVCLSEAIIQGEASILQIAALLKVLSEKVKTVVAAEFGNFGLAVVNFDIESISIPEDELKRVQDVFAKTLEARELSKTEVSGAYSTIKSFEVMNNAAANESDGSLGAMLGAGIGLGAGLPIGQQIGQNMTIQNSSNDPTEKLRKLKALLDEGLITEEQFDEKRTVILGEL